MNEATQRKFFGLGMTLYVISYLCPAFKIPGDRGIYWGFLCALLAPINPQVLIPGWGNIFLLCFMMTKRQAFKVLSLLGILSTIPMGIVYRAHIQWSYGYYLWMAGSLLLLSVEPSKDSLKKWFKDNSHPYGTKPNEEIKMDDSLNNLGDP